MSDLKFQWAEFTQDDGTPFAIDPDRVTEITVRECEETGTQYTALYTAADVYWLIQESYIEACQVVAAARTNNLRLLDGV